MSTVPEGIYPPIATPFRAEAFDVEAFRFNLSRWNETPLAGYVVLGSNGEGVFLRDGVAEEVIETASEHRAPDKFLIAGTGRESTRHTIELTQRAARAGAQAALVVPPGYYRALMTDAVLERHYREIADQAEIPILLYHVPKFSPVTFSVPLVLSLAEHPNIAGMKETSGDLGYLSTILRDRPDDFRVFVGLGSHILPGVTMGADGGIVALANVAPSECVQVYRRARSGDIDGARAEQLRLLDVNRMCTARHGVPGLKHALNTLEFRAGDPVPPLLPLGEEAQREVEAALHAAGLVNRSG